MLKEDFYFFLFIKSKECIC